MVSWLKLECQDGIMFGSNLAQDIDEIGFPVLQLDKRYASKSTLGQDEGL